MFGKRTADIILQRISRRLAKAVPKAEFFRVMDDVFVIVMDLSVRKEVSSTAISLLSALERPVVVNDTEIAPSVVIGICQFPVDGESTDALFSNCLSSVFAAKREGLKWQFYS
jgi:predicted signal transduction protein with EAL and GGDEF domain